MSTLLLRLAGPLQSWGVSSKYDIRTSGREPSKSGVVGMIASALGRNRDDNIDDLAALKFGVRTDQEGVLLHDFHTAHAISGTDSYVTHRYYLSDAVFLVGLEGDVEMLKSIESAINSPAYPLFLGRRSCPPSGPICLGLRESDLLSTLVSECWHASDWYKRKLGYHAELELIIDSNDGNGTVVRDHPVSFSQGLRQHAFRIVHHDISGCKVSSENKETSTQHDPFDTVGGR